MTLPGVIRWLAFCVVVGWLGALIAAQRAVGGGEAAAEVLAAALPRLGLLAAVVAVMLAVARLAEDTARGVCLSGPPIEVSRGDGVMIVTIRSRGMIGRARLIYAVLVTAAAALRTGTWRIVLEGHDDADE